MHDFDWNDLKHFLETVKAGSVTGAGARLGVSYTTVSRRITALERDLEASLFDRSGADWALTTAGEKILRWAEAMAETAGSVRRDAISDSQDVSGLLRFTTVDIMFERFLMPEIKRFSDRHPEIKLELISTDDRLSLSAREADIALRGTIDPPANVLGKNLCHIKYEIYGTPALAARHAAGEPVPVITWLGDGRTLPSWIRRDFADAPSVTRVSSILVMIEAAREGIGLAQLACIWGDSDPALRRIPNAHPEDGYDLWLLSHVDLRKTERVRLFRDFLIDVIADETDLIEGRRPQKNADG
ncbi:MAG: LysR family transcriptional regulator [Pseudomonadota bacterium]